MHADHKAARGNLHVRQIRLHERQVVEEVQVGAVVVEGVQVGGVVLADIRKRLPVVLKRRSPVQGLGPRCSNDALLSPPSARHGF